MKHAGPVYERIQDPAGRIRVDKPVILSRGEDRHTTAVARFYADLVEAESGDPEIVAAIRRHIPSRFEAWQPKKSTDIPRQI